MNICSRRTALRAVALLCPALLSTAVFAQSTRGFAQPASSFSQTPKPVISLDADETAHMANVAPMKGEASFVNAPTNFHSFSSVHAGETAYPERLTLRFSASTQLTKIESTKDFQVQPESSCAEQKFYSAGDTCTLVVRFTPQGPGRRLGKLTIKHTGS